MKSKVCEMFGIDFPLMAFTHCRDVVVAVSKAGGMGVLGAAGYSSEQLEIELKWIDEHIDGKPYGVDLIAPTTMANKDESANAEELNAMVPEEHKNFAASILARHDVDTQGLYEGDASGNGGFLGEQGAINIIDVALNHPIKLIVNALGVPPRYMIDQAKEKGVATGALVGAKHHAIKQAEAGVDLLICSGTEAGGHCGEISTMVVVPEVCKAVEQYDCSVVAAGGIVTGRQMAAAMAMGADGVWTGSVWLTTQEAETAPYIKEKLLSTQSNQTVRAKSRTGKYSRQVRSPWTDAWEDEDAPDALPMPLQSKVSEPALRKVSQLADAGHEGAKKLATFWVGQGVGMMEQTLSSRQVVYDFMEDFLAANERMKGTMEE
jgi:NAD(P)H-dependent flavin oxidoreductase YrpB (nitropropane dioxygenase family)